MYDIHPCKYIDRPKVRNAEPRAERATRSKGAFVSVLTRKEGRCSDGRSRLRPLPNLRFRFFGNGSGGFFGNRLAQLFEFVDVSIAHLESFVKMLERGLLEFT